MDITYDPDVAVPPRRVVPASFDAADPAALEGLAGELLAREPGSAGALETWLLDWSDLVRAFAAARTRRRVAMTRDTGNDVAREAYLAFERELVPRWRRLHDRFEREFLASPFRGGLGPRYEMAVKRIEAGTELFREENVPLLAEEEELGARYARLAGARSVVFRGERMREQQCAALLEEPDRATRAEAYAALSAARQGDVEEVETILDELIAVRQRLAKNAGCADYVEYRFRDLQRFDYGPEQCEEYHDAVERHAVPAIVRRQEERARKLGLASIRPYDRFVDPSGRPPPRAFEDERGLIELGQTLFRAVDPVFADEFSILVRNGLLDLMARPGKAPGGYNTELMDIRLPFIFANSVGRHADVKTLLHEGGHAFHNLATREEMVPDLSRAPIEFCEVASTTMELFGLEHFEAALPPEEARRAAVRLLEERLHLLTWVATVDAFQRWIYTHPDHTRAARREAWVALRRRFAPYLDWTGLEHVRETEWQAQHHIFRHALYYIEYGIALLGALQVWQGYRRDPEAAVKAYRAALALGGSRPLPELFETAGARFGLDDAAVAAGVESIVTRLREIEG